MWERGGGAWRRESRVFPYTAALRLIEARINGGGSMSISLKAKGAVRITMSNSVSQVERGCSARVVGKV